MRGDEGKAGMTEETCEDIGKAEETMEKLQKEMLELFMDFAAQSIRLK